MAVTNYYSVGGRIIGEDTSGVRLDYLTDALGSVTATVDQAGMVQNTYRYKPYGSLLAKTGGGTDPEFLWTGVTGSRTTGMAAADQYNRRRHYGTKHAGWTSPDPLWPKEHAYSYVNCRPTTFSDPTGLICQPAISATGHWKTCDAACCTNKSIPVCKSHKCCTFQYAYEMTYTPTYAGCQNCVYYQWFTDYFGAHAGKQSMDPEFGGGWPVATLPNPKFPYVDKPGDGTHDSCNMPVVGCPSFKFVSQYQVCVCCKDGSACATITTTATLSRCKKISCVVATAVKMSSSKSKSVCDSAQKSRLYQHHICAGNEALSGKPHLN